jgi:hypothetical protein
MFKMFGEFYNSEWSNQQKARIGTRNRVPTEDERRKCQEEAKKVVCEIGVSMYQFRKWLDERLHLTIEHQAIHEAIDEGIENKWFAQSQPRRFDPMRGMERFNVTLTDEGFRLLTDRGFQIAINAVYTSYFSKSRRRRI